MSNEARTGHPRSSVARALARVASVLACLVLSGLAGARAEVYVYGGDYNYPPYEFLDEQGEPSGFNIELVRAIAASEGFEVRFELAPWPQVLRRFEAGEIDISDMYAYAPREALAEYSQPIAIVHAQLFQRRGSDPLHSLADLEGRQVLVQKGSVFQQILARQVPGAQLIAVESEPDALRILAGGSYDAALVTGDVGWRVIRRQGLKGLYAASPPMLAREYAFVVPKGRSALLARIDQGLAAVRASGRYAELEQRWLETEARTWLGRHPQALLWALAALVLLLLVAYLANRALRRRVEQRTQALSQSEARYRTLVEHAPEAILIYNATSLRFEAVNAAAAELFRTTPDELMALGPGGIMPPVQPDGRNSVELAEHYFDRALQGETPVFEWVNQTVRGRCFDAEVRLIRLPGEAPLVRSTVTDVSERARATAELREQVRLNRDILQGMLDGYVLTDRELRILDVNPAYCRMSGYSRAELVRMDATQLDPRLQDPVERHRAVGALLKGGRVRLESQHRRKDGAMIDVEVSLIGHTAPDGPRFAGFIRDVTRRNADARRLQQAATVFASTAEGVLITDCQRRVLDANPAVEQITGHPPGTLIGQGLEFLYADENSVPHFESVWSTVDALGHWQGEVEARRRSGEVFPAWLNVSRAVQDHTGVAYVLVLADISESKAAEQRLEFLAHHDALTGLPNSLLLHARLEHALLRGHREGTGVAVVFVDLDRLKHVNDNLGHPVGDALLREAAQRLRQLLRDTDTVARLGGDEFILLIEPVGSTSEVVPIAEKVLQELERPFYVAGHELIISASMGIAVCPSDGRDPTSLLKNADSAMYKAKKERGSFQFYDPSLAAEAAEHFQLEHDLRGAISRKELHLLYQPQRDLESGRIVGVEALLRWNHPRHGALSPARFVQVAEETGQVLALGHWVLHEAVRQAARWRGEGVTCPRVAVNVSARQVVKDDLAGTVRDALRETGLPAQCLELELTESSLMDLRPAAVDVLREVQALGVHLSVDDFGTGYSSLSYLKNLPVQALKIDRGFVEGIPDDGDDRAICQAVIALGHSLSLRVIAEGVEQEVQLQALRAAGCDTVQGYAVGRPMPPEAIAELLATEHTAP